MDDLTERAWWIYDLPTTGAIVFVPANTEPEARDALRATHYKGAPVDTYPLRGSCWTSRHVIVRACFTKGQTGR